MHLASDGAHIPQKHALGLDPMVDEALRTERVLPRIHVSMMT
jgi:hypothetical protein